MLAPGALALDCPNVPLNERLAEVDVAFVGRVTAERPSTVGRGRVYEFLVDQNVKGPVGREVDVDAQGSCSIATNKPLLHDEALGVMGTSTGRASSPRRASSRPGALLAASDEPKGNAIRLVIGILILAAVLAYSIRRLRRRGQGGIPRSSLRR